MTPEEKAMLADFLTEAADVMGNAGCNDYDLKRYIPDQEQREQFVKEYHDYNGDPEEFDPKYLELPDFCVFGLLVHKLRKELGLPEPSELV